MLTIVSMLDSLLNHPSILIILENPWSANRVLLTLSELHEGKPALKPAQREALERFKQGSFKGFNPVELIEQSDHYKDKYSPSLRGYEELEKQFGSNIELRISTYPVAVTMLLTDAIGFFEPYIRAYQQPRTDHPINTFELEFPSSNYLYRACTNYFDTLWQLSTPYGEFQANADFWKEHLRPHTGDKFSCAGKRSRSNVGVDR